MAPVSTEVADRVQLVGDRLARLGAKVSDSARPAFDPLDALETYLSMLNCVMSGGIPDDAYAEIHKVAAQVPETERTVQALNLKTITQTARTWARQSHARAALRLAWRAFFEDWDLLVCPITAGTAFPHDHAPLTGRNIEIDGQAQPYFQQLFWAGVITVAYLPSTVFPTGPAADGLPIGLQAVGPEFGDYGCIAFAESISEEIGGFTPPPGFED